MSAGVNELGEFEYKGAKYAIKEKGFESGSIFSVFDDKCNEICCRLS